ncbi:MAG: alanine--tRNA ligase, partial [Deltaproteobacteria bacterium]|nr:alanine--tRNA ligase [Deltaproteobacteria bacterium]
IPGDMAFKLYDTYGLSVDIVEDVARDENLRVDMEGFDQAMSKQKTQSQESWKGSGEEDIPEAFRGLMARGISSRFLGYETLDSKAKVTAVLVDGKETRITEKGARAEVVLDQTPFYGEAGGQAGDTGWITNEGVSFRVTNTLKYSQAIIVHKGHLEAGNLSAGDQVETRVDEDKRKATSLKRSGVYSEQAHSREPAA